MSRRAARLDEEPKQPFEYMVENKDSQRAGSAKKPLKQSALPFTKKEKEEEYDDDLDSDEDELAAFDFRQHTSKPEKKLDRPVAFLHGSAEEKKKQSKVAERTLLPTRWPRGKVALPEGWTAGLYRYGGKGGKEIWVFSHPYYGETQHQSEMRRTGEEWEAVLDKRHAKKPTPGAAKGAESSADAADADADAGSAERADDDDPLAALLLGKRRREEEEEATREQVHEEMAMRMDTGVRVNTALQQMLG